MGRNGCKMRISLVLILVLATVFEATHATEFDDDTVPSGEAELFEQPTMVKSGPVFTEDKVHVNLLDKKAQGKWVKVWERREKNNLAIAKKKRSQKAEKEKCAKKKQASKQATTKIVKQMKKAANSNKHQKPKVKSAVEKIYNNAKNTLGKLKKLSKGPVSAEKKLKTVKLTPKKPCKKKKLPPPQNKPCKKKLPPPPPKTCADFKTACSGSLPKF